MLCLALSLHYSNANHEGPGSIRTSVSNRYALSAYGIDALFSCLSNHSAKARCPPSLYGLPC
jgi:hypothetical protein